MTANRFEDLFLRLKNDIPFRRKFSKNPASALRAAGFDPSLLELPRDLEPEEINATLGRLLDSEVETETVRLEDAAGMTGEDLWRRFGIVRLAPDVSSAAVAVAVVVYGVAVATSQSQVAVVSSGVNVSAGLRSFDQLKMLRNLQRVAPESLSFSIAGPDGVAVEGVNVETLKAFLGRLG